MENGDEELYQIVANMRSAKATWKEISEHVGISTHRLKKWRERVGYSDPQSTEDGSDQSDYYDTLGPHHLWHIGGYHVLNRYHIAIFGGMDGFSHAVIFLGCYANTHAQTITQTYLDAVVVHGIPSRLRVGCGIRSAPIVALMLSHHGTDFNRNTVFIGSGNHNRRIQRLWVDVKHIALTFYIRLFERLEQDVNPSTRFDPDDEVSLFVLHHLFLGMIDAELKQCIGIWNNHSLSCLPKSHTPNQMLCLYERQCGAEKFEGNYVEHWNELNAIARDEYGIHEQRDIPYLESLECPFSEHQYAILRRNFPPLKLHGPTHGHDRFEYYVMIFRNAMRLCRSFRRA